MQNRERGSADREMRQCACERRSDGTENEHIYYGRMNMNSSEQIENRLCLDAREADSVVEHIRAIFFEKKNEKRAAFSAALSPMLDASRFLGLTSPEIKAIVKAMSEEEKEIFLRCTPHDYMEEDLIHIHILNGMRDARRVRKEVEAFLPYMNAWSLTDSLTLPKIRDDEILSFAREFLEHENEYAVRLGVLWIMKRAFKPVRTDSDMWLDLALAARLHQETRQLVDVKGWMLCEAAIKIPHAAAARLRDDTLPDAVRLRAISKCMDSRRIVEPLRSELKEIRAIIKNAK